MKKTVEQKADIAKQKIDKKMQKQRQKAEKAAAKKENASAKKENKKEKQKQQKAAKQEINSTKKQAKKELAEQKKAAKKEAAERKKKAKQEAADKIKALKNDAKQGKTAEKAAKKEKKAKGKSKSEDGVVESGNSNKKKLFAGVLALVFVCGGVVGFLHFKGGNKEEETDPYIEAYVLDDDFVTSIPKFLGESEKRALPEITEEDSGSGKRIVYNYTELKDADEEVRDYINFLVSEKEFVPMFDYNLDTPGGYVSVGTTSQEEGKILKLDIDYTETDYKVMVSKSTEKLPEVKEKSDKKDISRDGALNYLTSFPAEKLGMEKPIEEYKTIYDMGQSYIDGQNCYGISLYEIGAAGTNVFQGKFFVATDQSAVFRYYPENDAYVELEKTEKQKVLSDIESAEGTKDGESAEETDKNGEDAESTQKTDKDAKDIEEEEKTSTDKKQSDDDEKDNDKKDDDEKDDDEKEKEDKKDKKVQKGRKEEREEQKQS